MNTLIYSRVSNQEVYDKKTPVLKITDYQLWVFAAKQRKDFQRLERIIIIYERWEKAFPEDNKTTIEMLPNWMISPLFEATAFAVEEAIINALIAAETMTGINGNTVYALPHDRLKDIMKKYNR